MPRAYCTSPHRPRWHIRRAEDPTGPSPRLLLPSFLALPCPRESPTWRGSQQEPHPCIRVARIWLSYCSCRLTEAPMLIVGNHRHCAHQQYPGAAPVVSQKGCLSISASVCRLDERLYERTRNGNAAYGLYNTVGNVILCPKYGRSEDT